MVLVGQKLDVINPKKYFFAIFGKNIYKLLFVLLGTIAFVWIIIISNNYIVDGSPDFSFKIGLNKSVTYHWISNYIIAPLLSILLNYLIFYLYGVKMFNFLIGNNRPISFLKRYCILVAFAAVSLLGFLFFPILFILEFFTIPILFSILPYGLLVILYWISLSLLAFILACCRSVIKRIVAYNKGAVAAITLIVTVLLGIFSLAFKS